MESAKVLILDHDGVKKTIKRLAFQVYERNYNRKEIVIAGIEGRGSVIAEMLCGELATICKLKIHSFELPSPGEHGYGANNFPAPVIKLTAKCIILVDDVLNTGRTLMYAMDPLMKQKPETIQTLVLVERNHRKFPVSADYIGVSISTTLQEHVDVVATKKQVTVFLR